MHYSGCNTTTLAIRNKNLGDSHESIHRKSLIFIGQATFARIVSILTWDSGRVQFRTVKRFARIRGSIRVNRAMQASTVMPLKHLVFEGRSTANGDGVHHYGNRTLLQSTVSLGATVTGPFQPDLLHHSPSPSETPSTKADLDLFGADLDLKRGTSGPNQCT